MRILQLHNRYQIVGGEEGVVQSEQALLRQYGHSVELLEVSNDDLRNSWSKVLAAPQAIYSWTAKRLLCDRLAQFQPDIVHVHNFFPLLSPSIYDACHDRGIPVIQTLHNYRLICPKAMLFRENEICEACVGRSFAAPGVQYGCYRDSKAQTAIVAAMLSWHQWRNTWHDRVNGYIALTQFQRQKLIQGGLPGDRIHVKPNFVFVPPSLPVDRQSYALFVGRLSEEKGVALLLEAYQRYGLDLPLKIVGDGPLRDHLQSQIQQDRLDDRIQLLGRRDKDTVLKLMRQAQVLVFPSIWYEGFPLTISEAFACGLPVIVPSFGSMAEIVRDSETGLHFIPRDVESLAQKLQWANSHAKELQVLGTHAQQQYKALYTPEANYEQLMTIYRQAQR
ncbi:glycosyltransferase [Alkalinema sp. FACHB-956]|uniref:glycosyltransferase n=1 Tax=Alkalinema sp. FACHB-956 TaxID=2692768 RepID=UPI0016855DF2|nr:glycosyltransferase [Alkalinema sp. FACHB-956]MBD2328174.1 glycosyltransferase [Alkalinema sp. FACHB-956]